MVEISEEKLNWLRDIVTRAGYDPDSVDTCRKVHFQNCGQCIRLECCDNTSPFHDVRTFEQYLNYASEKFKSWPLWKRNAFPS